MLKKRNLFENLLRNGLPPAESAANSSQRSECWKLHHEFLSLHFIEAEERFRSRCLSFTDNQMTIPKLIHQRWMHSGKSHSLIKYLCIECALERRYIQPFNFAIINYCWIYCCSPTWRAIIARRFFLFNRASQRHPLHPPTRNIKTFSCLREHFHYLFIAHSYFMSQSLESPSSHVHLCCH